MNEYQTRVMDEQLELNKKLVKLTEFTATSAYRQLPSPERELLIEQQGAMAAYNSILADRLIGFGRTM